jgi:hypothetical protein
MKRPQAPSITIIEVMTDPQLFGRWFSPITTWGAWIVFLKALFGLPMTEQEATVFRRHTGRTRPPSIPAREMWVVVGRRGGKSLIAALIAVYIACFRRGHVPTDPSGWAVVVVLAADREQAKVVLRYVAGLIDGAPMLARMGHSRTAEAIHLRTGVSIEVHTANFRSIRGRTILAAICDEIAFWRSDESANPDTEIVNAIKPAMMTVPGGGLLLCISSPYARRGVLWEAYRDHFGHDGDPKLVWQADTQAMNPSVPAGYIREQYEADPARAAAEIGAEFRRDVETFLTREAVEAVVMTGRRVLPPVSGRSYVAHVDPSGGSQDAMAFAIAHAERRDGRLVGVLDAKGEVRSPLSPDAVVEQFVAVLTQYGIRRVSGDHYAGEWPREAFRRHGIGYAVSDRTKSDIYREFLPLVTSGRVELVDDPRVVKQLLGLERRVSRSGRDTIDHAFGDQDDLANAVAGALVGATTSGRAWVLASPSPPPPPEYPCAGCGGQHAQGRCSHRAPTFQDLRRAGLVYGSSWPW